jgi:uncharacterized protein (TIGR03083 family)
VVTAGPLTPEEVAELLGAYALDACTPEETTVIEAVLADHPELEAEARTLARAASWIGVTEALVPPPALRSRVVSAARPRGVISTTAATAATDPVLDAYLSLSDALGSVVDELPPDALDVPTTNGLTAHELVVHMAAQESLLALQAGVAVVPDLAEVDIDARTSALLDALVARPIDDAAAMWRDAVDANAGWARAHAGSTVAWRGITMTRDDAIVVRAFETWIHTDDLRRALGRPLEVPSPAHLSVMSEFASRVLPFSLELAGRPHPGKTVHLVLTGEGGGEWSVALDGGEAGEPDVELTVDVVDWCRRVGDRVAADELRYTVRGDAAVAADLVAAASSLATL